MRTLFIGFLFATAPATVTAQVQDIGLTLDRVGQVCGPVTCAPLPAGTILRGSTAGLVHYSAVVSPFAIAIGLSGPCAPITGIGNALLLGSPITTLAIGITSSPPFVPTPCQQGLGVASLPIPAGAPIGLQFRLQSIGVSNAGPVAFGPAIEATIG